ncbi:hypothetical protein JG687_00012175 [Phytophthora cactorum]|uniref:Uncharacterized protein n=1 Tax=Phytophthora cactorum TaxID=29920 RepID=A0A8T1U3U4_9STRA|nr:hypothetical protein JG687_00012175 [Phytophthora cactorum]
MSLQRHSTRGLVRMTLAGSTILTKQATTLIRRLQKCCRKRARSRQSQPSKNTRRDWRLFALLEQTV